MPDLSHVTLTSLDDYRTYQYERLVQEYRGLIDVGLDLPHFLNASKRKWGLDSAGAVLAYREARGDL